MRKPIPAALQRAGIRGYSSSLQEGEAVNLCASTIMALFGDELTARLIRPQGEAHESGQPTAGNTDTQ